MTHSLLLRREKGRNVCQIPLFFLIRAIKFSRLNWTKFRTVICTVPSFFSRLFKPEERYKIVFNVKTLIYHDRSFSRVPPWTHCLLHILFTSNSRDITCRFYAPSSINRWGILYRFSMLCNVYKRKLLHRWSINRAFPVGQLTVS